MPTTHSQDYAGKLSPRADATNKSAKRKPVSKKQISKGNRTQDGSPPEVRGKRKVEETQVDGKTGVNSIEYPEKKVKGCEGEKVIKDHLARDEHQIGKCPITMLP